MGLNDWMLELRIRYHAWLATRYEAIGRICARRSAVHAIRAVLATKDRAEPAMEAMERRKVERIA